MNQRLPPGLPNKKKYRVETTPAASSLWSHYPLVCCQWFGSCPPHRVRLDDIAAFLRVRRFTRHRRSLGVSPSADLSAMRGSYPLRADSHQHLRACGPRTPSLPRRAEGLSYFRSPVEHVFAFCCFKTVLLAELPAVMCVFRGCRCLLSTEMPHTTCRSPVGYLTDFQDSVRIWLKMRPQPLNLRRCPRPQDLDNRPLPFAITVCSLVGREAGTTRSLRRLVFPSRAPEPPFVPRRTVSPSRPPRLQ